MTLLNFRRATLSEGAVPDVLPDILADFLRVASIEVTPRAAAGIADFRPLLPAGTRVYIAHIDGTTIQDMVATARRLRDEGFAPMPHLPARLIRDRATLADWIARYRTEAGVSGALVLGGGRAQPVGDFDNAMQLLDTGLFEGFARLHVAGDPEGNHDIDPDGSDRMVMEALRLKQAFAARSDARMAIVTQFCFDPGPVIALADRLAADGIDLPIHIGVAGPARLQTLVKFAVACGVGPSIRVLQRRARDVTRLVLPFEPTAFLTALAARKAATPAFGIGSVHLFPLGGIETTAAWLADHTKG